ncbi:DUF4178 domain-containing protein [Chitinophaga rhizophila]|uniref:DUF4178 domain-containing protein n=1 Tax=Chitinophaga rhizophila TaxID=2866212 RepID=A0ABS7G9L1_9BACT|nr:DUF4178 domain-containing protein [Chitinophaga rhizophila]MBW8684340.1 DUF4178 domain-containing protein [Chitinophaga rhizophila]
MPVPTSTYPCPSCSRTITFTSPHTTVKVCECGTVINKMGDGSFIPRPFHTIADKASVIAPGTHGQWNGKTFTVLGRFRTWNEETVINYWTIIFQDENPAYLVEGYGIYAIHLPRQTPSELKGDVIRNLKPGNKKVLNGEEYMLLRKETSRKWDVEGELYIPECNTTFLTYDFSSASGNIIHIIEYWPQVQPAFEVHYTTFSALSLTNKRPYENNGMTFRCQCGNVIQVSTFPYAQSAACGNCSQPYVYKNLLDFTPATYNKKAKPSPSITPGAAGMIKGINYKVIGYIMKEERNPHKARWTEYTLFNEQEGYAFLSEFEGHWIYLREYGKTPVPQDMLTEGFRYEGKEYDLFNSYSFSVISAQGEFPANPFNDGSVQCWEFISPPIMWSREESATEGIAWFKGQHVTDKELQEAFGDAATLPIKLGTGALQPNGYVNLKDMVKYTLAAVAILILIHLSVASVNERKLLVDNEVYFNDSTNTQTSVVGDVYLNKSSSNVMLEISSSLDNTWVEVEATLVNKSSGKEYSVSKGIEYYSGMDDGESWSEGNRKAEVYMSSIPGGDYTLQLTAMRDASFRPAHSYHVTAYYNVSSMHNLWICLGLLLIWPIFKYITTYYSEKRRWSNSPYSRFNYDS